MMFCKSKPQGLQAQNRFIICGFFHFACMHGYKVPINFGASSERLMQTEINETAQVSKW